MGPPLGTGRILTATEARWARSVAEAHFPTGSCRLTGMFLRVVMCSKID